MKMINYATNNIKAGANVVVTVTRGSQSGMIVRGRFWPRDGQLFDVSIPHRGDQRFAFSDTRISPARDEASLPGA
jgi:hypothetical protein